MELMPNTDLVILHWSIGSLLTINQVVLVIHNSLEYIYMNHHIYYYMLYAMYGAEESAISSRSTKLFSSSISLWNIYHINHMYYYYMIYAMYGAEESAISSRSAKFFTSSISLEYILLSSGTAASLCKGFASVVNSNAVSYFKVQVDIGAQLN